MDNRWIIENQLRRDGAIVDPEQVRIDQWAISQGMVRISRIVTTIQKPQWTENQFTSAVQNLSHATDLPLPVLVTDGVSYWIASNHLTVEAHRFLRREWIKPDRVITGDEWTALLYKYQNDASYPIVDSSLEILLGRLSSEEFNVLEQSILADGQNEPIIVWDSLNTVVDGYNRYKICLRNNLKPKFIRKEFADREDVISFMIAKQFGRRNLNLAKKIQVIYNFVYPSVAKSAQDRQQSGVVSDHTGRTDEYCGSLAGVSAGTWRRAITILDSKIDYVIRAWLNEVVSTSAGAKLVVALQDQSPQTIDLCAKEQVFNINNIETISRIVSNQGDTLESVIRSGFISTDKTSATLNDEHLPDLYKEIAQFNRAEAVRAKLERSPDAGYNLVFINLLTDTLLLSDDITLSSSVAICVLCGSIQIVEALKILQDNNVKFIDLLLVNFSNPHQHPRLIEHNKSVALIGTRLMAAQTLRKDEFCSLTEIHGVLDKWFPGMLGVDLSTKTRSRFISDNWTLLLEDSDVKKD